MTIFVAYPSGKKFTIEGSMPQFFTIDKSVAVKIDEIGTNRTLMLDPRALCLDENKQVIYDPRNHVSEMPVVFQEFMRDHPEWPSDLLAEVEKMIAEDR